MNDIAKQITDEIKLCDSRIKEIDISIAINAEKRNMYGERKTILLGLLSDHTGKQMGELFDQGFVD